MTSSVIDNTPAQIAALGAKPLATGDIANLTTAQLLALTTKQIAALSSGQLAGLSDKQVALLTTSQISTLAPQNLATIKDTLVAKLTSSQIISLTTDQIAALTTKQIAVLDIKKQIPFLSTRQIVALTTKEMQALKDTQLAALTSAQIAAIETRDLAALTAKQLAKLSDKQLASLTTTQMASLNTGQVAGLNTKQISGLTSAQVAALRSTQIAALSSKQIASLGTRQIAALSSAQIASLEPADIVALNTKQIAALSTTGLVGLTSSQIMALKTSQIKGLTTIQAAALTSSQLAWLTATQVGKLSPAQISSMMAGKYSNGLLGGKVSPIVLDLDDNGIRTMSMDSGVAYDIAATGQKLRTGWISGGDGFLVMDRNHDGLINDGTELFGTSTKLAKGGNARDGFVAMSEIDGNADGLITNADAGFAELKVWIDANADGVSQADELHSLAALNITALDLDATASSASDNGNLIGLLSRYETADGKSHILADVWFEVAARQPEDAAKPDDLTAKVGSLVQTMAEHVTAATAASQPIPPPPRLITDLHGLAALTDASGLAGRMQQYYADAGFLYNAVGSAGAPQSVCTVSQANQSSGFSQADPASRGPLALALIRPDR